MFAEVPLFPDQASTQAEKVDALFFFILGVSAFFATLIAVLVIAFAVKYRRRSAADRPVQIAGSLRLEIFWTVVPFLLTMIMFVWGASVFFHGVTPPDDAMEVYVVGRQWMWKIQYPGGQREINRLHVPAGKAVKLTMISEDVIHDFGLPAFRTKQDVLPGRYTSTWFKATRPGRYHLFCNQYCGTDHSAMIGEVIVMEQGEYQRWLEEGPDGGLAKKGRALFMELNCIDCHSGDAQARAPLLEDLHGAEVTLKDGRKVTADYEYLRRSILDPDADVVAGYEPIMPTFKGQVDEEEIIQLIAFIKSLGRGQTPSRTQRAEPPAPIKEPRKKLP